MSEELGSSNITSRLKNTSIRIYNAKSRLGLCGSAYNYLGYAGECSIRVGQHEFSFIAAFFPNYISDLLFTDSTEWNNMAFEIKMKELIYDIKDQTGADNFKLVHDQTAWTSPLKSKISGYIEFNPMLSQDLNPIKILFRGLKEKAKSIKFTTMRQFRHDLNDYWVNIPTSMIAEVLRIQQLHLQEIVSKEEKLYDYAPFTASLNNQLIGRINNNRLVDCFRCKASSIKQADWQNHLLMHGKESIENDSENDRSKSRNTSGKSLYSRFEREPTPYSLETIKLDEIEIFECDRCEYQADRKKNLYVHRRLKHGLPNDTRITSHIREGNAPLDCPKCDEKLPSERYLRSHIRNVHEKLYKCNECDYSTKFSNSLERHMISHLDKKLYRCTSCDYSTRRYDHLKSHIKVNCKKESHDCTICKYSFETRYALRDHVKYNHPDGEKYQCSYCDRSYSTKSYYIEHLKKHERRSTQ